MKRYCPKCGAGTEYAVIKPKSCGSCKTPYDGAISVSSAPASEPPRYPTARRRVREYDDDPDAVSDDAPRETDFDPNAIKGLDASISINQTGRHKITIGDLTIAEFGSGRKARSTETIRDIPRVIDTQAILNDMLPRRGVTHAPDVEIKSRAVAVSVPARAPAPKKAPRKASRKKS